MASSDVKLGKISYSCPSLSTEESHKDTMPRRSLHSPCFTFCKRWLNHIVLFWDKLQLCLEAFRYWKVGLFRLRGTEWWTVWSLETEGGQEGREFGQQD
jgi:hypothetical protein